MVVGTHGPFVDDRRRNDPFIRVEVGQVWHVRLPGGRTLSTMEIVEKTKYTVLLKSVMTLLGSSFRYETLDVEFLEQVTNEVDI